MNTKIIGGLLALVVVAGGAFWGGTQYARSQSPQRGQFGGGQFAGAAAGAFRGMRGGSSGAGGFTAGQIVSKNESSVTLKEQNGSSVLVLFGTSTEVMKSAQGNVGDLSAGDSIVVTGTPNSDGSITAQSIQLRPAGASEFGSRAAQH